MQTLINKSKPVAELAFLYRQREAIESLIQAMEDYQRATSQRVPVCSQRSPQAAA
jgi:predicted DNA-binding protein